MTKDMSLGRLLGQHQAFSVIAARCSAADAALLQKMRSEKLYLDYAADWKAFCSAYLHMSDDSANRAIHLLEEFGPSYFDVSQLTRISAATYRAIAPSIDDQGLHHNGEAIALIPENAEKVAAAVAELRKAVTVTVKPTPSVKPAKPEAPPQDPHRLLDEECSAFADKIERSIPLLRDHRSRLKATVCGFRDRLNRIDQMI
jgi:hypothetical protein